MNNERLGNILLKKGLIDSQELDFCLSVQKNNGKHRLGRLLCHYDFVNEKSLALAIATQVGWEVYEGEYRVDEEVLNLFGIDFFIKHLVFPVKSQQGIIFILSTTDDTTTTDIINHKLGLQACFYLGVESELRKALEGLSEACEQRLIVEKKVTTIEDSLNQWFEHRLNQAVISSASDIHIEPSQKVIEVRYRIDGVLIFIDTLPLRCLPRLTNIIFHMAEVTISDFSHFHDARFIHKYLNREIDVRVSHIPSVYGSALVLRLLDKNKSVMTLSDLGYGSNAWRMIQKALIRPEGINLIVGPTGCGKTTTLYAILNHLKSIENKILTIEDPVEIQLPLMTQVQIHEKKEISFSQTVRAFLRHDPDIILIGEIRDSLTAQEALRGAMTGHQIFSTLHTSRALDAVLRLNDLGVPFAHMSDHLSMIVAQRLVRKLCPLCKKSKQIHGNDFRDHKYLNEPNQIVYMAVGCASCRGGYKGQTVIAEIVTIDEGIAEFIAKGDLIGLKRSLKESNHLTMEDEVRRLVAQDVTSIEEAQRVLG